MKAPTRIHAPARSTVPRIESDTPIVPRAVMEAACEEAAVWLGQPLPRRWVRELTARANTVYAGNPGFRRNLRAGGDKGRDCIWAFVRHWLAAQLQRHRPQLFARLPAPYSAGHPLPPIQSTLPRPLKAVPQLPPRAGSSRRSTPDYAFAAAAHFHFL